jgi:hypothetical protein
LRLFEQGQALGLALRNRDLSHHNQLDPDSKLTVN